MNAAVLITGGSGLLAINWALAIRNEFSVFLGLHAREISLARVAAVRINIESVDESIRIMEKLNPKIVIHTAGLTSVEDCEAEPDLARHVNVELAVNVAQACARLEVPLVHISTDHLFNGKTAMVDEAAPIEPQNVYARTKAEAEQRVLETNSKTLVVRTNFFGWGPSYRRSFSDLIIDSLRKGEEVTLFEDVFYTPILSEALIRATHELVSQNATGILHLVGDERVSKYQFGRKLASMFQLNADLINPGLLSEQKELVQRPSDMSLSNRKACQLLGRNLGGADQHLEMLRRQEKLGIAGEVLNT